MSEDHKAWLLVNTTTGKEAVERFAAFHEDKWLNTQRGEINESPLDNHVPFERETVAQRSVDLNRTHKK